MELPMGLVVLVTIIECSKNPAQGGLFAND